MSTDVVIAPQARTLGLGSVPVWAWFGVWAYATILINGNVLLGDSDTYWQILTGKWIIEHHALPRVDFYSFTRSGVPWISSSWLAQVLYAQAYELAGWAGPVVLSAAAIAATAAQLAFILSRRIAPTLAVLIAFAALMLFVDHMLARPYVLAFPFLLAWANGLLSASERREPPSLLLLPLIAVWANLHGGFLFGLVLVGGFALDALWNAEASQRRSLALRWAAFGIGAVAACCVTPYGWQSFLAARNILDLGEVLHVIAEWMPVNFSTLTGFGAAMLMLLAAAFYAGIRLSPPRIALLLGLMHMALSHVRNVELFALLVPLVMLEPVATQFGLKREPRGDKPFSAGSLVLVAVVVIASTWAFAARATFAPPAGQSPAAAVATLKASHAKRVLNDLPFGGYLIWQGIPVFLDGRAELYGETFEMAYFRALQLKDVDLFLDLLKRHDIDATLLTPGTPAVGLLDRLDGWRRVYADDIAVVHARVGGGAGSTIRPH
ncbi:hypothetical protein [Bradyrhizobium sp. NP1]|uniref:hypothetical protein n=1 Tax=Bradyrhizobium sp. NP1 TaxID=3049772 RepID=UPI0025A6055C|nr:hypothetical protein [Bradyrhizobium sp. NP1]WJR77698.1 hypothetical protein QOU61_34165 [Bradyrhizobium sp. NP1]